MSIIFHRKSHHMTQRIIPAIATAILLSATPLSVFAQTSVAPESMRRAQTTTPKKTLDVACIQAAVDKREAAIIAALDTYHSAAKTAFETRRSALQAAWAITDRAERRAALKAAWAAFRKSTREASSTFRKARRTAWEQYRTDRKACGTSATSDDTSREGNDLSL